MALTKITDHTRRAILNLPPPLWGKPRIASCLRAITDEVQEAENVLWDILEIRLIDNADLTRLIVLGKVVGEPYLGYAVETYRQLIKVKIRINRGHGTIKDIIDVANLAGINSVVWEDAEGPAVLYLEMEDAVGVGFVLLRRILDLAIAAGVTPFVWFTGQEAGPRMDDTSATVTIATPGTFGDASGAVPDAGTPLWHSGDSL